MYRQLVHEITQTFTKISQDIILITKQLEDDHSLTTIATIVTGIQNNEKDKLEKVCETFAMNIFIDSWKIYFYWYMQAYITSFSVSFKFKIYVHIESKDISDAVLKVGAYVWKYLQTVNLQLARQNATDHPTDSNFKEEEADLKQRYFKFKYGIPLYVNK